jgi:hypothetical protein
MELNGNPVWALRKNDQILSTDRKQKLSKKKET